MDGQQLARRISKLSPEQRKLFEFKLIKQGIDILQLPIYRVDRAGKQHFPLAFVQERLWLIHRMEPENIAYNLARVTKLEGELDKNALRKSIDEIIRRHEILRTIFILENEKPAQVILPASSLPYEFIDLRKLTPEEKDNEVNRLICAGRSKPFDLSSGPLLRTALLELDENEYVFLLIIHHIVSDGTSIQVFIRELMQLYRAYSCEQESPLPELDVQYVDFTCWQRRWFRDAEKDIPFRKKQEKFWCEQFQGEIPLLNLPCDYPRPPVRSFEGNEIGFSIHVDEARTLKHTLLNENTTLYVVLLAVFNVFLAKLSGMEDIIVGTPAAGRRHPDVQPLIGMFVNTLVLRNFPCREKRFADFLREVKNRTLSAFENQEYRYEDIIEKVKIERDTGRNPLFDVMFLVRNVDYAEVDIPGLKLTPYGYDNKTAKFDLVLEAWEIGDTLRFSFEYCTKIFMKQTIERYIGYFKQLLRSVINHPDLELSSLEILPDGEKERILVDFNDTGFEYPDNKTIHQLFEEQVERVPGHIALAGQSERAAGDEARPLSLTYRGLNDMADNTASLLKKKGILPGAIAVVLTNRSTEMVIALLGILKAGAAYLPIDPGYPAERTSYILADSGAKILITSRRLEKEVDKLNRLEAVKLFAEEISIKEQIEEIGEQGVGEGVGSQCAGSGWPAYIIYTSGTTGRPKGIPVWHGSFVNLIYFHRETFRQDCYSRMSQVAGPGFDAMAFETWPCLSFGSALYIIDETVRLDPAEIKKWLIKHRIHISFQPTIIAERLLDLEWPEQGTALKTLLTAGDRLTRYPSRCYPFRLFNLYGPTEDTVWTTWTEVEENTGANEEGAKYPSIGKPIGNHRVYIIDPGSNFLPIGVAGELCISGAGLAAGYLNNPELTAEKFIDFTTGGPPPATYELSTHHFQRLYHTGDLTRWLPDGNIEFLGRIDYQVKIRGFRIELTEIESLLLNHKSIKQTLVTVLEKQNGEKYLCAYVVCEVEFDLHEINAYLSKHLPEYMVPPYIISIEKIPLTPAGKIDRKQLAVPQMTSTKRYAAPRNAIEEMMVRIWQEVLGNSAAIGIDDNFFELGGHSLNANVLISKIEKNYGVKISIAEMFRNKTIRNLSDYMKRLDKSNYTNIDPVEAKEYYPLSSAQQRFYFLQQLDMDNISFNMPLTVKLLGKMSGDRLEETFKKLIYRHESLRTSFLSIDDEPVQRINKDIEFEVEFYDAGSEKTGSRPVTGLEMEVKEKIRKFVQPFDLSKAPLIRLGLIRLQENEHVLLLDMHHIISDGVSMNTLIEDFTVLFSGQPDFPLKLQYKDFCQFQNALLATGKLRVQENFWLNQFSGELPLLNMPTDYPRPEYAGHEAGQIRFEFDEEITRKLNLLMKDTGTTLFMVLLSIYNVLLGKYTRQEDIVIGLPAAGRNHPDLQGIIGLMMETLALRNFPEADKSFSQFLAEVKMITLTAFENQSYPFRELMQKVAAKSDLSRNPLFDAMINVWNYEFDARGIETGELKIVPYEEVLPFMAKVDISLEVSELENKIFFRLFYCKNLYKRETMERFALSFTDIAAGVLDNPGIKLGDIEFSYELDRADADLYREEDCEFDF